MFWRVKAGSTSVMFPGRATDTTGAGLAIAYNTSGLVAAYRREGASSFTSITLATATAGTWTSGGLAVPSGGVTGAFELHPPNAAFATGAKWVEFQLSGASGMQPLPFFVALDAVDNQITEILLDSALHSSGFYSATSTQYAFTAGGSVPSANAITGGLKGRLFSIISGTGAGQDRVISASSTSVGVLILTFETALEVTPDNTSVWVIWRDRRPVLDSSLRVKALDSNGVVFDSTDLGASAAEVSTAVWAAATRTLTTTMQVTVTSPFIATKDLPAIPLASGPSFQWTVVDSSGNAIDLSAKTVRFVVASADSGTDEFSKYDDTLTGEFQYQSGTSALVISGGSSNVVTVQTDSDDITAIGSGEHRYWLWDVTTAGAERVLVKGKFPVEPAVRSV